MTGKVKHTPGPWITDDRHDGDALRFVLPDSGERLMPICTIELGKFNRAANEANAVLIAAAPDLFDACEMVKAHLVTLPETIGITRCLNVIGSAIAKAEGIPF